MSEPKGYEFYAVLTPINYTVTFNPNGGTVTPTTKIVAFNTAYGTLPTPTRTGYTFVGWFTKTGNSDEVKSTTKYSLYQNQTVYAHWSPIIYSVQYMGNSNSAGSMTTSTHTYDVAKNLTTNKYTRIGHTFAG